MATMFYARDGRRPDTQEGPGIQLTSDQLLAVVGTDEVRYCGRKAPSINPDSPSRSKKNVVIELEASDQATPNFPHPGFYWVLGLSPAEAELPLQEHTDNYDN